MSTARAGGGWAGAAAFLFLNALFACDVPADPWSPASLARLSPDALGLLGLVGLAARPGPRSRRLRLALLAAAAVALRLVRCADTAIPLYFHRPFSLAMDLPRLPDLLRLIALTAAPAAAAGLAVAAAGAAVLLGRVVFRALSRLGEAAGRLPAARASRLAAAALAVAVAASLPPSAPPGFAPAAAGRLGRELARLAELPAARAEITARFDAAARAAAALRPAFARLEGAAVYVVFVESYGANAWFDPRLEREIRPVMEAIAADLTATGFRAVSALRRAPTAGGGSWLSHASLASGVRIDTQLAHDLLPASALVPLAGCFREAGYRTLRAMPGTRWPSAEMGFFGFEETRTAADFGYAGPAFGFSPVPDQYVLEWVGRRTAGTERVFVEAILTGSHTPFDRRAPYLADWEAIGDGRIYRAFESAGGAAAAESLAAHAAYGAVLLDSLQAVFGFALRHLRGNELLIVLGDHAPPLEIPAGVDPFAVPVHVVTRREPFLAPFAARGFRPGLPPPPSPAPPGLESLFWDLLGGFSQAAAEAAPEAAGDVSASRSPGRQSPTARPGRGDPPPG